MVELHCKHDTLQIIALRSKHHCDKVQPRIAAMAVYSDLDLEWKQWRPSYINWEVHEHVLHRGHFVDWRGVRVANHFKGNLAIRVYCKSPTDGSATVKVSRQDHLEYPLFQCNGDRWTNTFFIYWLQAKPQILFWITILQIYTDLSNSIVFSPQNAALPI